MKFEEYVENVINKIQAIAGKKYHIEKSEVVKNNNVRMTGIVFGTKGCDPCVYLDEFYREYESGGMEFDETVDRIYDIFMSSRDALLGVDLSALSEWETARGIVYAKLVNTDKNKELLDTVPHRMFLDLTVLYYAIVGEFEDGLPGTMLIDNKHAERWGQEEDSLYRQAMENMRAVGKPNFRDMGSMICSLLLEEDVDVPCDEEPDPDAKLYVLTNCRRRFGAAEILDGNTLRMVADKIGDGFIALPGSVHELIILPPKKETEYGKLAEMVREVNATQVPEEEYLSSHVYVYNRDEDTLKIAV